MKPFIPFLVLFIFLQSCANNKECKQKIHKLTNVISAREATIRDLHREIEKIECKVSNSENENKKKRFEKMSSELESYKALADFLDKPGGKALTHVSPSECESYIFLFDNKKVVEFDLDDQASVGIWECRNDSLIISYEKNVGKRGVGKPNKEGGAPTSCTDYLYDEYVQYCEKNTTTHIYTLIEIARSFHSFKKEGYGFREISKIESQEILKRFDIELNGNYTQASEKLLTPEELKEYTKKELNLMKNEIYARYGYRFKSRPLSDYFNKQKWYRPQKNNVDRYFSHFELENIKLIKQIEAKSNE